LRKTATFLTEDKAVVIDKEFDAFQKLFGSFLASESQVLSISLLKLLT